MNGDNIDFPSREEEAAARAMFELAEDARGVVAEATLSQEFLGPEPTIWGGVDPDGWSQISVRVPPGSPVDARRLWIEIGEAVAAACEKVGIPVEGGDSRQFRHILEERLEDPTK